MEPKKSKLKRSGFKMKDYTTNNYCDFLWISDLLELKRNSKSEFIYEAESGEKSIKCDILNVVIFGTVVEVREMGGKGVVYQVDDGTGVIACKQAEMQFEDILSMIEQEQVSALNHSMDITHFLENSVLTDTSANDSVFNDKGVESEHCEKKKKKSRSMELQSIWGDIYKSFSSLIKLYSIGESVIVQGRLYSYFNTVQIYINSIRVMDVAEEIMEMAIKLEDCPHQTAEMEVSKTEVNTIKRMSGFATFDTIPYRHPKVSIPTMETPEGKDIILSPGILTPNLSSTVTFDTFTRYNLTDEGEV